MKSSEPELSVGRGGGKRVLRIPLGAINFRLDTNTNTEIHKNTNTKWSRGIDILRVPLGTINFRSAELMIAKSKAGRWDE